MSGTENPVKFEIVDIGEHCEIIHSLAKWKRLAIYKYNIKNQQGLYTDMNAIRKDEELDNIHSIYVDQWDWEKNIAKSDRNEQYLRIIVEKIYKVFIETESFLNNKYHSLNKKLPEKISYITTQELEDMYPNLSPKRREYEAAKKFKAFFLMKIGGQLKSGKKHDNRAPDYDDWDLNGDIIFYNDIIDDAFELSSMGIRVDDSSLLKQLENSNKNHMKSLPFHKMILSNDLPFTIGGGIGQSRICMFFLEKAHIGEVQASIWPENMIKNCENNNIPLL